MKYLSVHYNPRTKELEMLYHLIVNQFDFDQYPLTEKQWHVKTYLSAYDFDISQKIYKHDEEGLIYNLI